MCCVYCMFQLNPPPHAHTQPQVCHICNFKDRSDYNKAPLWTLPVGREGEVVALFHATVHLREHDFGHAIWWKLHFTIHYTLPPLPQMREKVWSL